MIHFYFIFIYSIFNRQDALKMFNMEGSVIRGPLILIKIIPEDESVSEHIHEQQITVNDNNNKITLKIKINKFNFSNPGPYRVFIESTLILI